MKPIQDIRPRSPRLKKVVPKKVEEVSLDREAFTKRINELAARLNYEKQDLSRKERFLRAVHRYNRFGKPE